MITTPPSSKTFAILALLFVAGCAPVGPAASAPAPEPVRNVVIMVTDGGGVGFWSAAKLAADSLAVERMPVAGLVDTRSSSSRVTDSAAGATVYATGVRTFNGAIGVGPRCRDLLRRDSAAVAANPAACDPLESVFEVARRRGMATGVVTTTAVTDATPAAFVAKSPSRYWQSAIARQFAATPLEVILGGGRRVFEETPGADGRSLLQGMCERAACVRTAADLATYRPDDRPLVGLFTPGDLPRAGERAPSLPRMVEAALARLGRAPRGFIAVFETEGTDNTGHSNEGIGHVTREILEFDRAVGVVLDFAERNAGTLVIVTADHETGGMTLPLRRGSVTAVYSTGDHTAAMVPLFAYGPGADRFGGIKDNAEVGRLIREAVDGRR